MRPAAETNAPAALSDPGTPLPFSWKPVRHLLQASGLVAGETMLIDSASGAIESVLGQLGKLWGARVVGLAAGSAACRLVVEELGFDDCIDVARPDWPELLVLACPRGVDVYMAAPGHPLPLVLQGLLTDGARVPRCGLLLRQVVRRHPQLARQGLLTRLKLRQRIDHIEAVLPVPPARPASWLP